MVYSADLDLDQLNQLREQHLGRLLLKAYRAFSSRAVEKLRNRGYSSLAVNHTLLLMNIDVEGMRQNALADRIGVSRQAIGKVIDSLERGGYISRKPDDTDKRAVLVSLTEMGWRLIAEVVEIKAEIEVEFSDILGKKEMENLRSNLSKLLKGLD